jgi:ligand-binding sensor domain-containing protein
MPLSLKHILLGILLSVSFGNLSGQTPIYFHYDSGDGLPSNLVYCSSQDEKGSLWFGTDNGLVRFDGINFQTFGVDDGLPDPEVLGMTLDSKGKLWLFCFRKNLAYWDGKQIIDETQDSVLQQLKLTSSVTQLFEDQKSNFWIATSSRTYFCLDDRGVIEGKSTDPTWQFAQFDDQIITFNSISIEGTRENKTKLYYQFPGDYGRINNDKVFNGCSTSGNRILYAFSDCLFLLEWRNGTVVEIDRKHIPGGQVYTDKQGRFWVCSLSEGALCFDNNNKDLSNPKPFLPGKKITHMSQDQQGTFWFCTLDDGIYGLPKNALELYFKSEEGKDLSILNRNNKGELLIGDKSGNIYFVSNGKSRTLSVGNVGGFNTVRQVMCMPDENYWIVADEKMYHYRNKITNLDGRYGSPKAIYFHKGRYWCGTSHTLGYWLDGSNVYHEVKPERITCLESDSYDNLWAGNIEGLFSEADQFDLNWGDKFPSLKSRITAIKSGGNGKIWIATATNGLISAETVQGKITAVQPVPLSNKDNKEVIRALFMDTDSLLWLASNRGVKCLDKGGNVIRTIDSHHGLPSEDINSLLKHQDTLWLGTPDGIVRINLKNQSKQQPFWAFISKVKYTTNNQNIQLSLLDSTGPSTNIVLPADAELVNISFTANDYRSNKKFSFNYSLREELGPWINWTFDNLINVLFDSDDDADYKLLESDDLGLGVHLPPGKYRIEINALNINGIPSKDTQVLNLTKPPIWHQVVWISLLIWLIVGYGTYRIIKLISDNRNIRNSISLLHLQALKLQINPHFIGNSINGIQQFFYPPDPEKASKYISIFTRLLRQTMLFSESHFVTFTEEAQYCSDYLDMIAMRFEGRYDYTIDIDDGISGKQIFPSMILQPLLENASTHGLSPDGKSVLNLEFKAVADRIACTITDNGPGITNMKKRKKADPNYRESKGLKLLQEKIKLLNTLYPIDLHIQIRDRQQQNQTGTQVVLSFKKMDKLPHQLKR